MSMITYIRSVHTFFQMFRSFLAVFVMQRDGHARPKAVLLGGGDT